MARASVFANWRVQIENTKNISNLHVGSMNCTRHLPKMLFSPALARESFSLDRTISHRICRCSCPWLPCISRRRPRGTWRHRTERCTGKRPISSICPGPWAGALSLCCSQLQWFAENMQSIDIGYSLFGGNVWILKVTHTMGMTHESTFHCLTHWT